MMGGGEKLAELLGLLELDQIEENIFRAFHPKDREGRLYGGQIMAQALMAGGRTVAQDMDVHSLHGYFLRPGDPKVPAVIRVERARDGRSFSTRRILVTQRGEAIFNMDASFQIRESGLSHQAAMPDLQPPPQEKIPPALFDAPFVTWRHEFRRLQEESPQPPEQFVWFKPTGSVPEDPLTAACLLVYESDNVLIGTARLPHRGSFKREHMQVASLDHAMWFHRPISLNQWLLYAIDSPSASQARGFARGNIFSEGGELIASTVQEGLIRVRNP
jgi:acyl-CoA thioesterase-2